jgi:hypothetical protein
LLSTIATRSPFIDARRLNRVTGVGFERQWVHDAQRQLYLHRPELLVLARCHHQVETFTQIGSNHILVC